MTDEHTRSPVPESSAVGGLQIGLICIGIAITLPSLYTGGELARGLGLADAALAVVVGALALSVMSVPAAVVGARTRLSSYMIIEHVFGHVGAKFINLAFGIVLLGWYAVTAELFGRTLFLAAAEVGWSAIPEWLWVVISSAAVVTTTIYGFKAIDRLALFAVPLLGLFLVWIVGQALEVQSLPDLLAIAPGQMSFADGVSVVIGAMIVNVVLLPDFTRYARTRRDCIVASFMGNGGGVIISTVLAMVPALALGMLDAMSYMMALGTTAVALIVLVFATWTTNGVNLYSTGLVAGSALPSATYGPIVLVCGVLGTGLALIGVADRLVTFLIILGLVVPPVAGVYLTRYFLLGRQDFGQAHFDARPAVEVPELLACVVGGGVSGWAWAVDLSFTGIVPVESLVLSSLLYLGFDRLRAARPSPEAFS